MRNCLKKFQNFSQSFGLVENRFNWLCKTTHGQLPILACFKPKSFMVCSYLIELEQSGIVCNVGLVSMVWFVGF